MAWSNDWELDQFEKGTDRLRRQLDEQKTHNNVWKKRGELLRSVLKVNGDFRFAIGRIIGTAEDAVSV